MRIEIDPTVDFACKLLLGNPEFPDITIHFLNAILRLPDPIVSVEIVNPIVWKEFEADARPVFKRAVGVLEVISRTPDQRRHYDARLKWELDENTRIQTAFEEGEALGRIELIRALENLLQMQTSSDAELRGKSIEELRQRAQYLQELIRNRSSS